MTLVSKTSSALKRTIICAAAVLATAAVFVGCKGRTASAPEPTGDTVEVCPTPQTQQSVITIQNDEI